MGAGPRGRGSGGRRVGGNPGPRGKVGTVGGAGTGGVRAMGTDSRGYQGDRKLTRQNEGVARGPVAPRRWKGLWERLGNE